MSILKEIPLFQNLTDEQLDFLSNMTRRFTYKKDSIIINQGDSGNSLYVILRGELKVTALGSGGKQIILAFLGQGNFVGELSLLDDAPRSATVQATEDTETMQVTQEVFHSFVESFPETLLPMLRMMSARLRELDETVCLLATHGVYGRVRETLLKKAVEENGVQVLYRRFTQEEIAEMVGSSREMVSRILTGLSFGEYISYDMKKRIQILKHLPERF